MNDNREDSMVDKSSKYNMVDGISQDSMFHDSRSDNMVDGS